MSLTRGTSYWDEEARCGDLAVNPTRRYHFLEVGEERKANHAFITGSVYGMSTVPHHLYSDPGCTCATRDCKYIVHELKRNDHVIVTEVIHDDYVVKVKLLDGSAEGYVVARLLKPLDFPDGAK